MYGDLQKVLGCRASLWFARSIRAYWAASSLEALSGLIILQNPPHEFMKGIYKRETGLGPATSTLAR